MLFLNYKIVDSISTSLQADVLVERRGEYEKERLPSNIKIGIRPLA
jgi:hypothetical protein